ncbi:MAG: CheB methylesterase domain-containing protein [Clostridium sp.]|nr:CheB methylesterase domain-containing protein [Clostridium sp.]
MRNYTGNKLVIIASSTGGPKALHQVIPKLDKNLDAPVVVVQHMPKGFTESLSQRLDELSEISVREASDGEILQKGNVYIARGGLHMRITENQQGSLQIHETEEPPVNGLRPCANITFDSILSCPLDAIVCAVLTGMGADGCTGIEHLKKKHNIFTIAQNRETCVVYGMPKAVVEHDLADLVLPLDEIGETINIKTGVY